MPPLQARGRSSQSAVSGALRAAGKQMTQGSEPTAVTTRQSQPAAVEHRQRQNSPPRAPSPTDVYCGADHQDVEDLLQRFSVTSDVPRDIPTDASPRGRRAQSPSARRPSQRKRLSTGCETSNSAGLRLDGAFALTPGDIGSSLAEKAADVEPPRARDTVKSEHEPPACLAADSSSDDSLDAQGWPKHLKRERAKRDEAAGAAHGEYVSGMTQSMDLQKRDRKRLSQRRGRNRATSDADHLKKQWIKKKTVVETTMEKLQADEDRFKTNLLQRRVQLQAVARMLALSQHGQHAIDSHSDRDGVEDFGQLGQHVVDGTSVAESDGRGRKSLATMLPMLRSVLALLKPGLTQQQGEGGDGGECGEVGDCTGDSEGGAHSGDGEHTGPGGIEWAESAEEEPMSPEEPISPEEALEGVFDFFCSRKNRRSGGLMTYSDWIRFLASMEDIGAKLKGKWTKTKLQSEFQDSLELQIDLHMRYDLSLSDAARGLAFQTFRVLLNKTFKVSFLDTSQFLEYAHEEVKARYVECHKKSQ